MGDGPVSDTLSKDEAPSVGVVAVICESETTVTPVAAVPPISTDVASVKLVPLIVTDCPPEYGPVLGVMPVICGRLAPVGSPTNSSKFGDPVFGSVTRPAVAWPANAAETCEGFADVLALR